MTRVLLVLPFYGGSLPVGRYCALGLKEAGCLVEIFESPDFFPAFSALKGLNIAQDRLDFLENSFLQHVGQAVMAKVEAFAPDLVLAMAQAPLPRQTLKRLRKDGVPTAMWFVEDFRLFTYWRAFAPFYDIFAVIQREPFLGELAAMGVDNALYLPLAAQPDFHKPLSLNAEERKRFGSALSFMGAGYPNRRALFREFTRHDFKIWGTEWEEDAALAPLVQANGARISPEDTVRIYNASDINLNVHSSVRPEAEIQAGDFVNPRTFEVAACGAFQLVDKRALLPELFAEDELATFGGKAELHAQIERYLRDPEARAEMAGKARARVLTDHTYAQRMRALLGFAAERLPASFPAFSQGWPQKRKVAGWPDDMPQDLQDGLRLLLESLSLPPQADFDTVIAALRSRNGELEPLEAALLFMDEWKKQYSR